MFVRCEDCNYENLAQHSFCGMCGAKLPSPKRAAPLGAEPSPALEPRPAVSDPPAAPVSQRIISGPSLLGLGNEPTDRERVNYLLEDDPGDGSWRRWAVVLVLLAAVGGSGWHWRSQIRGWIVPPPRTSAVDANTAQTTAPAEPAPTNVTANPPAATPAPAAEGTSTTPPPSAAPPPQQSAASSTQPMTDAVARTPETKEEKPQDAAVNPTSTQPAAPADNSVEAQPNKPQPVKTKPQRRAPTIDESAEALESQGENYLYGRGVQADCGRAGKSLLAAAAHSSLKAQSVLGTMYATGHCVTRDVPAAYRWFAKALHQDPGNVRLQRDLEVLWQQMTPEEREIAAKTGP